MESYYIINILHLVDSGEEIEEGDWVNIVTTNGTCFQCWKVIQLDKNGIRIKQERYDSEAMILFEDIESIDKVEV